jgi:hypothetical protein
VRARDSLTGYRSLLHGKRPQAKGYPNSQAEVSALVTRVPPEVDQVLYDSDILRERCLLFVASTRGREALYDIVERVAQSVPGLCCEQFDEVIVGVGALGRDQGGFAVLAV